MYSLPYKAPAFIWSFPELSTLSRPPDAPTDVPWPSLHFLLRYHFPPHLYTCSHLPILLCQFWSQTSSADPLPDYCVTYVLVFVHAIVWPYCLICNLFLCLFCCCLHQRTWEVHEILVNRKKNTCLCDCVTVGTDEQKVWFRASSALCCYSIGFLWFFDLDFNKPHSLWVRNIRLFSFPNAKNGTAATVV